MALGSILKDIINSNQVEVAHLDKIFRQAAKSKIIINAHRVNNGKRFLTAKDEEYTEDMNKDFFYINDDSQENMVNEIVSLCKGRLKTYGDYDFFKDIQILTPTKKGMLGTKELNNIMQQNLNPNCDGKLEEMQNLGVTYRVGDRVMQVKNNYDISWEKIVNGELEVGKSIFNGEIGIIEEIDSFEKEVYIRFEDDKIAIYEYQEMEQIEHSYVITIHKSQRK